MRNQHDNVNHTLSGAQVAPPRIVMLLANDFTHDTRVFKQARSLIEWGCEVHIVATARTPLPSWAIKDGIHVHRVPTNQRSFRHVLGALTLWWSRSLLRRHVCGKEALPIPVATSSASSLKATAPQPGATSGPSANGTVRQAVSPVPTTQPKALNRSLPARAFRRSKVYVNRLRKKLSRLTHIIASIPARVLDFFFVIAHGIRNGYEKGNAVRGTATRRAGQTLRSWFPPGVRLLAMNHQHAGAALSLKPDIVVAHDLNMLFAAMIVRRINRTPVVYDSHELYLERNIGDKNRFTDKLVWWPVESACIGRCAAVMTVANGICDHLQQQYGIARPTLVRNVQPYEPPAPRTRLLSEELGIDPELAVVIYAGAITINRGLEQMIDSAVHLRDAVYVIMGYAGNPAYLESLKHRAVANGQLGRRVFFRDAVPIEDVVRYVASADVGIVPTQNACLSYQFESSNKIFHCLMAGVPLVMSDHIEKRHIAETYGVGVLFDETQPQAIAQAVHELLDDRARYERMRQSCINAARELNWEHEEYALRRVYAGILGARAQPVPEPQIDCSGHSADVVIATKASQSYDHTA